MYIKKLGNSSVLKRGESLIVLKCSNRYHDDVLITYKKALELDLFNSTVIARKRFLRLADGRMADASDTRERLMSGGPIAQPIQPGRSSKIAASPSRSGQNGAGIDCQLLTTISFFDISEAGKSIVAANARTPAASIAEFTALHAGISEKACKIWIRGVPDKRGVIAPVSAIRILEK